MGAETSDIPAPETQEVDDVKVAFKCGHTLSNFPYASNLVSQHSKHIKTSSKTLCDTQAPLALLSTTPDPCPRAPTYLQTAI